MLTKELDKKISIAVCEIIDMVKTYNRSVLYYGDRHRMTNKGIFDDIADGVLSLYGVDIHDPKFVYECMDAEGYIDLISFSNYIKTHAKFKEDDKKEIKMPNDIFLERPDAIKGVYKKPESRCIIIALAFPPTSNQIKRIIKNFGSILELLGAEKDLYMIDYSGESFDLYFRTKN